MWEAHRQQPTRLTACPRPPGRAYCGGSAGGLLDGYPRIVPKDADSAARLKKRTLTNLYNERPAWLANAHRRRAEAVSTAYGWPADESDDDLLGRLLALNLERAAAHGR